MSELAIASTHYGDLSGTVSIDECHGPFFEHLRDKVKIPAGYWPIGIRVSVQEPSAKNNLCVSLIAVDCDVGGVGGNALAAYVKSHDEVPAFEFYAEVEVTVRDLLELVKELEIVALSQDLLAKPVKILPDR